MYFALRERRRQRGAGQRRETGRKMGKREEESAREKARRVRGVEHTLH